MITNSIKLKLFLLLATLVVTLFFGLYPKDFGPEHKPSINAAGDLEFTRYALATAEFNFTASPDSSEIQTLKQDEYALVISLVIPRLPETNTRFSTIFSVNDRSNNSVVLLGQWSNYLIIMSGNDYPNKTDQPRLTVSLDSVANYKDSEELYIQIHATSESTAVTINEQKMIASSDFIVSLTPDLHLVSLGNTLDRRQGWPGTLRGFSLSLSSDDSNTLHLDLNLTPPSPWTLHSAFTVFSKQWLSLDSLKFGFTDSFNKDVAINLLGFVPVSLALFVLCSIRFQPNVAALQTIAAGAMISLSIESVQVFLPSRTSSMIDLTVNSFAAVLTALACYLASRWLSRKPRATETLKG